MRNDVMFTGVKLILEAFDRQENPYFSVWKGRDLLFGNNDGDQAKASILLEENLKAWEQSGNNDALKIVFHPGKEPKYINTKTPVVATMYVRVTELTSNYMMGYPGPMPGGAVGFPRSDNALFLEKLTAIESRLNAMEAEEVEAEEDAGMLGNVNEVASSVNALLNNPMIAGILGNLFNFKQPAAVAGIPESADFKQALDVLSKVDPNFESDIILLAKMAVNNRQQFLMLLTMLRNNK